MNKLIPLILLILLALLAAACTKEPAKGTYMKSSTIMYTVVSITVVAESPEKAETSIDAAFDEIRRLEKLLSFWTEDSEIAEINKNAGLKPVKVSPETLDIVEKALFVSSETKGSFDPTIGPVIRLWDFKTHRKPSPQEIAKKVKEVNYLTLKADAAASTVYLYSKGMSFDTGGIAKGYAADLAAEKLKALGISGGLVSVAGDIRAFGTRADGTAWRVGIRDPRSEDREHYMAVVELKDEGISTSGDYERFFVIDGKRYHHILNPKTGMPAEGSMSVTVIAPRAVYTDGFSTGAFVLGPEEGIKTLERLGYEGLIITSEGKTLVTPGMRARLEWEPESVYKVK